MRCQLLIIIQKDVFVTYLMVVKVRRKGKVEHRSTLFWIQTWFEHSVTLYHKVSEFDPFGNIFKKK